MNFAKVGQTSLFMGKAPGLRHRLIPKGTVKGYNLFGHLNNSLSYGVKQKDWRLQITHMTPAYYLLNA